MPEPRPAILILDDESMITSSLQTHLELDGRYDVVAFDHPAAALQYLETHPVDLIISDQMMPEMSGLEFFERVKRIQPESIRILLTGYAQKEDAIRAINEVGLYQYLEKPWSSAELDLVVRNGLERRRLYTSLQKQIGDLQVAGHEIDRLKDGLVALYLEKSVRPGAEGTPATDAVAEVRGELRQIVGSEVRSSTRRLLYAFVAVSVLLIASVSYIVYGTFFSIRREAAGLKVQLSEIKSSQLKEADVRRWRAEVAAAAHEADPGEKIIADYEGSVCLIQGAFIFRDPASGRPLRFAAAGPEGQPKVDASGNVDLTLDGDGPPLEQGYTGTGFLATSDGQVITNRHVAQPWWADTQAQKILEAGLRPEVRFFVAYFPNHKEPYRVKTRKVSEAADVALLEVSPARDLPRPIPLEENPEAAKAGAPVLLIGFPLGLEALLARASEQDLVQIPNLEKLNLQQIGRELARRGLIRPFITQGHISNVTQELLVYDAATTLGGSGGPLLSRDGKVVAVNFAVLEHFSGASMGLHIRHALALLAK